MTDMHAHVLPSIDDGPKDEAASLALLEAEHAEGVDRVICTSHFYPKLRPMDSFADSRDRRIASMQSELDEHGIGISLVPAAEVYVDRILFNYDTLSPLCIGSSRQMLLELPDHDVTFESECELIQSLAGEFSLDPIIAHIERVPYLFRHYDRLEALCDAGFSLQLDAESVLTNGFFCKQFAVKCIKKGLISYIGSDCHNIKHRAPNLKAAYEVIAKHCGEDAVLDLKRNAAALDKE